MQKNELTEDLEKYYKILLLGEWFEDFDKICTKEQNDKINLAIKVLTKIHIGEYEEIVSGDQKIIQIKI